MKDNSVCRREFIKSSAVFAAASALSLNPQSALGHSRKASALCETAPAYYPFKVGSFECVVISDGTLANTVASFGPIPDTNEADKFKLLEQYFLKRDPIIGYQNTLFVKTPNASVLIDTGSNGAFGPQTGKLIANLNSAGINPNSIDAILISHAHPDHINGLINSDDTVAFPRAEVFIDSTEFNFWNQSSPDLSKTRIPNEWRPNLIATAKKVFSILGPKLKLFKDKESPIAGITAIQAAGHTPGHSIFEISSGNEQLFYTADLCNHHVLLLEKPEWSFAFDIDPVLAVKSKKQLFDRFSSDKSRLMAYHFPFPGLWNIAKTKTGYRWVPESWMWA